MLPGVGETIRYMERITFDTTKYQQPNTSSIESSGNNTNITNSIELPQEIDSLITGSDYWQQAKRNRYKKLIREGHLRTLLQLAQMARTKNVPAHWFATACSKVKWEHTLEYLAQLAQVQQAAVRAAEKLGSAVTNFIYQQIWQGVNVERWADLAAEIGRHKAKYFVWLCKREGGAPTQGGRAEQVCSNRYKIGYSVNQLS